MHSDQSRHPSPDGRLPRDAGPRRRDCSDADGDSSSGGSGSWPDLWEHDAVRPDQLFGY